MIQTKLMGILNITPDSFSGDGILQEKDPVTFAIQQAEKFIQEGADILDIGAESTRPGASIVTVSEEIDRILPVISAIRKEFSDVTISVDTYKSDVAEAALNAGANWINDVWGFKADPRMAYVAANFQAKSVIMHNRLKTENTQILQGLGGRYIGIEYDNLIDDIRSELFESIQIARDAGLEPENIIIDPGIGFGKTVDQNLQLINQLDEFLSMGYPLLLGPSRKSFIGYTLNLPPEERMEGTLASIVIGILRGASIVRVHDVKAAKRAITMTDAILNTKRG